jgi:hypothetical protein
MKKFLLTILSICTLSPMLTHAQCSISGSDKTLCSTETAILVSATQTGYATFSWSTSGTGTFSSPNNLSSVYSPSPADIATGTVNLTISASGGTCSASSAVSVLTIVPTPAVNAGTDQLACAGGTGYFSATATGSGNNYQWTSDGTGTFSNQTSPSVNYIPSPADITAGGVTLTFHVINSNACTSSDQVTLVISPNPTVNAGNDQTICTGGTATLSTAVTTGNSFQWNTSGTGTFSNATVKNPSYTPSAADITAGTVTVTFTAATITGCTASDQLTLTILKGGILQAGPDQFIASGSASLTGSASNVTSIEWTSNGSGTFSNPASLATTYIPSSADVANGIVKIRLTSTDNTPCSTPADELLLTIGTNFAISGTVNLAANELDKGVVLLFKQQASGLRFIKSDTIISSDAGVYNFEHVPAGTYVLLASPITGSSATNTFLPTYSGGTQTWDNAQPVTITSNSTHNISLTPYVSADPNWNTGTDIISGLISVSENASANARTTTNDVAASYVTVYLKNASENIIAYTQTDINGIYIFNNVKAGNYTIATDFAGTGLQGGATSIPVAVDGLASTIENKPVSLEERTATTTGIINTAKSIHVSAYPNPAKNTVSIDLTNVSGSGEIKLLDETGTTKIQQMIDLSASTITLEIESLPAGLYILQLVTDNKIFTSKVIKY